MPFKLFRPKFKKCRQMTLLPANTSALLNEKVAIPDCSYSQPAFNVIEPPQARERLDDLADLREQEYPQLNDKTYLDHGGTTLYASSLVQEISADLLSNLYGNPHSESTPAVLSSHRVEIVRERALSFFGADANDFDLIFVANASAAIKLAVECLRDYADRRKASFHYNYHKDAHTSLVGIRELASTHKCFISDAEVNSWIHEGWTDDQYNEFVGLFGYPGQSNMTGRRLPVSWPSDIRQSFRDTHMFSLLDAAALASTSPLNLSDPTTAPDFIAVSFYKIFGLPDLGALIVRKDSAHALQHRKIFCGGNVEMTIAIGKSWHAKKELVHDRLEDGTLPFHSIFALGHAINIHQQLYGTNPMRNISNHICKLGKQLYDGLCLLKHANGIPLCRIYKDENAIYGDASTQGGTIAFNVQRPDGSLLGYTDVEKAANKRRIYLRSGALCCPGGVSTYLDWSAKEMRSAYDSGHRCSNPTQVLRGKATGVIRVSLGAMSNSKDVHTMLAFLREEYIDK